MKSEAHHVQEEPENGISGSLNMYMPVLVIVVASFGAGLALFIESGFDMTRFMAGFMGLFLLVLALLKFFDYSGFVHAFAMYDIGASRWPSYAYSYPFIEAFLGLLYLSGFWPFLTNLLTFSIMTFGAIGALYVLCSKNKRFCMFTFLATPMDVPVGTISLIESLSMAIMAFIMLIVR